MKVVIALFALVVVALAKPSPQLPPGITAAECPNYPFCGAGPGADQVPANQILYVYQTTAQTVSKLAVTFKYKFNGFKLRTQHQLKNFNFLVNILQAIF